MKTLMIYGAAEYTGSMVAEHARAAGVSIIVAGRTEALLSELAARLGLPSRVFAVDDPTIL